MKNHSTRTIELFCAKNCLKKKKDSRNKTSWKNRPSCTGHSSCKGYSLCKMVSLFYKFKMPKRCENYSTRTLDLLCAKNRSKKHSIFEKGHNFENRPFCKGSGPCIGYSLCKMVSLGQKLKMPKRCEKPFYKKNCLKKTQNSREITQFGKIGHLARAIYQSNAIVFENLSVLLKI